MLMAWVGTMFLCEGSRRARQHCANSSASWSALGTSIGYAPIGAEEAEPFTGEKNCRFLFGRRSPLARRGWQPPPSRRPRNRITFSTRDHPCFMHSRDSQGFEPKHCLDI